MRLYLETTIPNFLFADDAPDKKRVTEEFFEWLRICPHELCVSPLVRDELNDAPEPKRSLLLGALRFLPLTYLQYSVESKRLAGVYIKRGVIPQRYERDALHVAIAVCHRVDIVVSWNLEHLVRPVKVKGISQANAEMGYPPIRLQTPAEVMGL